MLQFLINNGVFIAFIITMIIVGMVEFRRFSSELQISEETLRTSIQVKIQKLIKNSFPTLVTILLCSFFISVVVFRELFSRDAFNSVLLTMLVVNPIYKKIRNLNE